MPQQQSCQETFVSQNSQTGQGAHRDSQVFKTTLIKLSMSPAEKGMSVFRTTATLKNPLPK